MTSKPSWYDAPEWANWLAQNKDGNWYWYEMAPFKGINEWLSSKGSRQLVGTKENPCWEETRESKP